MHDAATAGTQMQLPPAPLGYGQSAHAASKLTEPHQRIAALAAAFGFDGASYLLFGSAHSGIKPDAHWSTADPNWLRLYRRYALHGDDPRVLGSRTPLTPNVWTITDASGIPKGRFARLAWRHGIRSGVAFSVRNEQIGGAVMCWDCADSIVGPSKARELLGALLPVSCLLLESVWSTPHLDATHARDKSILTPREVQCLVLAANGMTSTDISIKLGISERTANFHFGNIIAKLHVLNRGEAIARAIALGIYRPPPRAWAQRA